MRVYARPAAPAAAKAAALRRVIGIDAPGLVVPRRRLSAATAQTTARRHKRPHKRPHTRLHTRPHKRVDKRVHQGPHSVCRALDSSPGAASRRRPEVSFIYSFPKFMVRRRLQAPPQGLIYLLVSKIQGPALPPGAAPRSRLQAPPRCRRLFRSFLKGGFEMNRFLKRRSRNEAAAKPRCPCLFRSLMESPAGSCKDTDTKSLDRPLLVSQPDEIPATTTAITANTS